MKHISAAHLIALSAMSLPARAEERLGEEGIEITTVDEDALTQAFREELNQQHNLMRYGGWAPPPIKEWQEKLPPTRCGNNRPIRTAERRAKNKAARKSRMQQRRKAKQRGLALIESLTFLITAIGGGMIGGLLFVTANQLYRWVARRLSKKG